MADLKTNYVDDVLDTTKNKLRKYKQIQNDDGTVSFVDVTEYTQVGTSFGAKDINDTNAAINDVNGNLTMHSGSITTDYSVRPILYRANSFEAMVYIDGLKNLTKGKTITIATLPEIARPTGNKIVDATSPSGAYVRISVTASGLIEAYLYTDITPENVIITFTYIK